MQSDQIKSLHDETFAHKKIYTTHGCVKIADFYKRMLFDREVEYITFKVDYVKYKQFFIELGLAPNLKNSSSKFLFEKWWVSHPETKILNIKNWVIYTKKYAISHAINKCDSFYLMFHYPELIYNGGELDKYPLLLNKFQTLVEQTNIRDTYNPSHRPKTNMNQFNISSPTRNRNKILNTLSNIYPVTRYSCGMTKSLYHDDDCSTFCGTFYYFELESSTYLTFNKKFVSFSKTKAFYSLIKLIAKRYDFEFDDFLNLQYENYFTASDINTYDKNDLEYWLYITGPEAFDQFKYDYQNQTKIYRYSAGYYPLDLKFTPDQILSLQRETNTSLKISPSESSMLTYYNLGLYAYEDYYDQPLCELGRELGYDIIVLTNMIGSYQVVSEILDTRDRITSFSSLIFTE